jgi:hypothetical protein
MNQIWIDLFLLYFVLKEKKRKGPHFRCKQIQENQTIAWFLKSKKKNLPKQETLDLLEMTVQRVGEKAENQRKTKGEIQGTRTSNDLIGFLRQKKDCAIKCAYTLWIRSTALVQTSISPVCNA